MITFEEKLQLAIEFNKKIVAGQKVGKIATSGLIRSDELSVDEIKELVTLYPKFEVGKAYSIGDLLHFEDELYEVIQAHTSQADWTPDIVPALFKIKTLAMTVSEWVKPTGSHDAYNIGDKVLFEGKTYESLINANTWSPVSYPQGWKLI